MIRCIVDDKGVSILKMYFKTQTFKPNDVYFHDEL
jgi:hypothetical protein